MPFSAHSTAQGLEPRKTNFPPRRLVFHLPLRRKLHIGGDDDGGDRLRSSGFEAQRREAMIECGVLNRMFQLGKPTFRAVAA